MAMKAARIIRGPSSTHEHKVKICEKACDAWFGRHGSGDLEIPLSVVAVLAMLNPPHKQQHEMATMLINAGMDEWLATIRGMWGEFVRHRPDLVNRVWPLMEPWHGERRIDDPHTLRAAKGVSDAVLLADLLGWNEMKRHEDDLLGLLLTMLRPKSALQARGQFYTPGPICELMARMTGLADGDRVHDPCIGTGGMWRGAAVAMRDAGRDPATCTWVGVDLDYLAVAACAVNVVVWGLGFKVLLGVGDGLTDDWYERAIKEREETVGIARDLRMLNLLRGVDDLVTTAVEEQDDEPIVDPVDVEGGDDEQSENEDQALADDPTGPGPDELEPAAPMHPEPAPDPTPAPPKRTRPARPAGPVSSVLAAAEPPPLDPVDESAVNDFWDLVDQVGG